MLSGVIPTATLTFRRIDVEMDGPLCLAHFRETSMISYGTRRTPPSEASYLPWLGQRVEEFPDGHVLAFVDEPSPHRCVGQLELQIPYGMTTGYINLFFVTRPFRGLGFGQLLHEYTERYFRSWEAREIELHVSSTNERAIRFYRHLGYRLMHPELHNPGMWRMIKPLEA